MPAGPCRSSIGEVTYCAALEARDGDRDVGAAHRPSSPRGKQLMLNRNQEAHLVSSVHSGEHTTLEVAKLVGVGRSTVYRAVERHASPRWATSQNRQQVAEQLRRRRPGPHTPPGRRRPQPAENLECQLRFGFRSVPVRDRHPERARNGSRSDRQARFVDTASAWPDSDHRGAHWTRSLT